MFPSSLLLVALFALLSAVSSRPLPPAGFTHSFHHFAPSVLSSAPVPTDDGCNDDPYVPSQTFPSPSAYPSPTTDDCSEPSSPLPSAAPPTSSVAIPATSLPIPVPTSAAPASVDAASSSGTITGGVATYFYQDGNAGACGQVNPDSALICAMDQTRFGTSGSSPLCGQQVQITNLNNGNTLTVTIADDCPTCENENSIDLSVGAFQSLSDNDLSIGEFPISWSFV